MADIKVEPRRRNRLPAWLLAIPVLGLLLFAAVHNDHDRVGRVPDQTIASVNYQGHTWVAEDHAINVPDARMKAVGKAADGRTLYAADENVGGGGGGGPVRHGTAIADHIYVRTGEGWYRPLTPATGGAHDNTR